MRTGTFLLAVLLSCPVVAGSGDRARAPLAPSTCDRCIVAEPVGAHEEGREDTDEGRLMLYLRKATGSLKIDVFASRDTYQAYFHVPIPFHEQAPVLLDVACPDMIDYRFVREDPPNLLVAARMLNTGSTQIDWTSWVLVKGNPYPDFPSYVPIPTPGELPDSVRQWLDTTDCCQVSAPTVQFKADSIRDTTTNLVKVAQDICDYCYYSIPRALPHQPYGFDAVYALTWGNSCTGHAHAAAALLRACGIPARVLLNMPVNGSAYDMHWIIDYYVPNYGWVRMETSSGVDRYPPQNELIVRACQSGDEFPVWFPCAIDAEWHTSDTAFGMWYPSWYRAHNTFAVLQISDLSEPVDYAIALTDSVYGFYSSFWGIGLTSAQSAAFQAGLGHQTAALDSIQASDLPGYLAEMQQALVDYRTVNPAPIENLYSEGFESGPAGWTHGGTLDEWELGLPTYGPASAHSGQNCWGTNLDGPYSNNEDCWLESPPLDLSGLACADLIFWVWNSVQDVYGRVYDPVWVEISRDGAAFDPLSSRMGGVNDDPEIAAVGGWSRVFLDLFQYLGDTVRLRFRFRSDDTVVFAGCYIDVVQVTGRRTSAGVQETRKPQAASARPAPSVVGNVLLVPEPVGGERSAAVAHLLDGSGRKVLDLHSGANDLRAQAPGVYFVREAYAQAEAQAQAIRKVVLTR